MLTIRISTGMLTIEDKEKGEERDKYLLLYCRELRVGATQSNKTLNLPMSGKTNGNFIIFHLLNG